MTPQKYRGRVCLRFGGIHKDELTMQFTALRKSLKTMPEVNCFATLSVATLPEYHLPRRPLGQLLKMQYDFLRTVRRRGPFQQAGLNRWDVVEGAKERNWKQARKKHFKKDLTFPSLAHLLHTVFVFGVFFCK